jgi:hypothetical protein
MGYITIAQNGYSSCQAINHWDSITELKIPMAPTTWNYWPPWVWIQYEKPHRHTGAGRNPERQTFREAGRTLMLPRFAGISYTTGFRPAPE